MRCIDLSEYEKTLSEYPELLSEWHSTENGELKLDEVTYGSHKKVWWLCPKGHSYDALIYSRTGTQNRNCPYCSGRRVGEDNNLKYLFPKIAAEWHPTKNGNLKPEGYTTSSHKRVWWLCPKGHSYDSVISDRTRKKPQGCIHCYRNSS